MTVQRIFVAGATGVLGRRAVRRMVEAGHQVTGVARTPVKAELLEVLGAVPAPVDLFDPADVARAVRGHDVVCNLATHIPPASLSASPRAWAETHRLRTEGASNLVDAAISEGAARYVQESVTFVYPDRGDRWIDEDVPPAPAPITASALRAEEEAARFASGGGASVVLRFAEFYGSDSAHTLTVLRAARLGWGALLGAADAYSSVVTTDDAATAAVAALAVPAGTYNVVDDEPMTRRDQLAALAAALGVRRLRPSPGVLIRLGGDAGRLVAGSRRVSNARLRAACDWAPRFPSAREGWRMVVDRVPARGRAGAAA